MLVRSFWLLLVGVALAACAGATPDCERIRGARPGLCLTDVDDRGLAPTDPVPVLGGDGEELSLEELRGRVVVLNFWASWCGPCRVEQPDLNEAAAMLPEDEVAFLGVNIEDTATNAQAHEREFDIPYPSLYDPANAFASRFGGIGPRTIPTTVFLDREGRVATRIFGVVGTNEVVGVADAIAAETAGSAGG